jgi:hypothetical protein
MCSLDSPSGSGQFDMIVFVYGRIGHGAGSAPEAIPIVIDGKT